eukprot:6213538-Pleurochrysis_carterae.AAC.3
MLTRSSSSRAASRVAHVVEAVDLEPARLGEQVLNTLAFHREVWVEASMLGVCGVEALQQARRVVVLHVAVGDVVSIWDGHSTPQLATGGEGTRAALPSRAGGSGSLWRWDQRRAALLIGSTRMRRACRSHTCSCRLFTLTVLAFVQLASTVERLNVRVVFNRCADGLVAVGSVGAVNTICALLGVPAVLLACAVAQLQQAAAPHSRSLPSSAASRTICRCAIRRGSQHCC